MSLRLKSRMQSPPNGFLYEQKETGWKNSVNAPQTVWNFKGLVEAIKAHRQQNPRFNLSTNVGDITDEVDRVNAARVNAIPGGNTYVVDDGGGANPQSPLTQRLRSVVAGAANTISQLAQGGGILVGWVRAGGIPVEHDLAEKRASICVACPNNSKSPLTDWFTVPLSQKIAKELEERKDLNLTTSQDANLHTCSACLCPLPLKLHLPLDHILKDMKPEMKAKLHESCWILAKEVV